MNLERPDLTGVDPDVLAYIEALEAALEAAPASTRRPRAVAPAPDVEEPPELSEPPTTRNVITLSHGGMIKRTPRHLYGRQRRSGMGIFDLELPDDDSPTLLCVLDEAQMALALTSEGRAFRFPVAELPQTAVRARGQSITRWVPLRPEERVVALLPDQDGAQVALVSERGQVQRVRASFVGSHMIPGMRFHDVKNGGPVIGACWTSGKDDLFIATQQGLAARFPEERVHDSGSLGIRLERNDAAVGIAAVNDASLIFLLGADGKGALRAMEGFAANKMPGAGGKVALKTERLAGLTAVTSTDDLLIISGLSKIIRFQAVEVPPKTGVVQGVACISLRSDEAVAVTTAGV
ncbi:MAG: hypothetical protein JW892_13770 [Anaerolineae bacterium]|nr:hypothetical protein [Anaerolineae bacterium]